MKNLLVLLVLASTIGFTACGQKYNVPAKVKSSFTQKFPEAKRVKWDKENDNEWEAEFKMKGKEYSANFDNNGNWKETEYEIKKTEIPDAVQISIAENFKDYKIKEAEISETTKGKFYEFELKKGEAEFEVAFSPKGELVKKEEKKEDDDEDND